MVSATKFLFETSFDKQDGSDPQAGPPMPPPREYTEEDLAAARAQGRAEGEEAGRAAALASIEETCAKTLSGMAATLKNIDGQIEMLRGETIQEATAVVSATIRKVVPELASRNGLAEIERLIRECLQAIYDEPRVAIRAHASVIALLQERIDAMAAACGFSGKIVLLADDQLRDTDCRVEWADGGAERHLEAMWQQIEFALTRLTGGAAAPAAPHTLSPNQPS